MPDSRAPSKSLDTLAKGTSRSAPFRRELVGLRERRARYLSLGTCRPTECGSKANCRVKIYSSVRVQSASGSYHLGGVGLVQVASQLRHDHENGRDVRNASMSVGPDAA